MLPVWWASSDDRILCPDDDGVRRWLDTMRKDFPLAANPADCVDQSFVGAPWGWSVAAARRLHSAGATVPSPDTLRHIRMLSHRRTSIRIIESLRQLLPFAIPPTPVEAFSMAEIEQAARHVSGGIHVKSPWSSSGRGVMPHLPDDTRQRKWLESTLRRQGSVMCENSLDCASDFAMLFESNGAMVRFIGYSLFHVSRGCAYGGNLLVSDSEIERRLEAAGANISHLHAIRQTLEQVLPGILGDSYRGVFGIDMMLTRDASICPCIELNLRRTMGVVALEWRSRWLASGLEARYTVVPARFAPQCSYTASGGRLTGGCLWLTPPPSNSAEGFAFVVEVNG